MRIGLGSNHISSCVQHDIVATRSSCMIESQWDAKADREMHGNRVLDDVGGAMWHTFVVSGLAYQKRTMQSSHIHSV